MNGYKEEEAEVESLDLQGEGIVSVTVSYKVVTVQFVSPSGRERFIQYMRM